MNASNTNSTVHAFEEAGLGRAPFRFTGAEDTAEGANAEGLVNRGGMWTTPGGTCAYCGHAIVVLCHVVDADGKRFHVGSDCIAKVGDKGMIDTVKRTIARRRTKKRNEATRRRIERTKELMTRDEVRKELEALGHPMQWRRDAGDSLLDWCEWMLSHGGMSAGVKVCKIVEKIAR